MSVCRVSGVPLFVSKLPIQDAVVKFIELQRRMDSNGTPSGNICHPGKYGGTCQAGLLTVSIGVVDNLVRTSVVKIAVGLMFLK